MGGGDGAAPAQEGGVADHGPGGDVHVVAQPVHGHMVAAGTAASNAEIISNAEL